MKTQWNIIHDCDTEEGNPTCWTFEINHEKYGKYVWITEQPKGFSIEVDKYNTMDFEELAICKSLVSAKRWVSKNLI